MGLGDQDGYMGAKGNKMEELKQYQFAIAFENSICGDYVTEKIWQPLSRGSIPIYLGTTDVDKLLPDYQAIVRASDFESPAHLAQYVKRAMSAEDNGQILQKHLAWTQRPFSENFQAIVDRSLKNKDMMCILCDRIRTARIAGEQLVAEAFPACQPYNKST
jgi:hypothetical protein